MARQIQPEVGARKFSESHDLKACIGQGFQKFLTGVTVPEEVQLFELAHENIALLTLARGRQ
jgi:hypothetical protein